VTVVLGSDAARVYAATSEFVNQTFGWWYVVAVNVYLVSLVAIGLSEFGTIRLGGPDAAPEFSTLAWLAMLFSAGMGVGLLFFGVAEPISHLLSGGGSFFDAAPNTSESGRAATILTMFHWGVHPWAIYGIVGLSLAFFSFNRDRPLSFRSIFQPVLADPVADWSGRIVDLTAVIATVFGLATAVGLASLQITAGLDVLGTRYLGAAVPTTHWSAAGVVVVLMGATVLSTWLGIERGIRRLSGLNVAVMVSILLLVVIVGPSLYLVEVLLEGTGGYARNFVQLSLYIEALTADGTNWQHAYTIFYWGFWISWAPFVGIFLARISKGRTVREFVAGVLVVPVTFSVLWMAAFSGAAIHVELAVLEGGLSQPLQEQGRAVALFELFSFYPLAGLLSVLSTLVLVTFFVTSADSASLVLSYLTAGGSRETTRPQRAVWPAVIGVAAIMLLFADGLGALKTAVVTVGLPFSIVILGMIGSLYSGLRTELIDE